MLYIVRGKLTRRTVRF